VAGSGEKKSATKPLFMHFSGPTGVGKTLSAGLIAKAMFSNQAQDGSRCGFFTVIMTNYKNKARGVAAAQQEINGTVSKQLSYCPRSLIVFDEIQNVEEDTLDAVLDLFYGKGALNAGQAVVIMLSDLGSTKLSSSMDRDQATKVVKEEAHNRFERLNKKVLLDNIVPFLPLGREDLEFVAESELTRLGKSMSKEFKGLWSGKLTWSNQVINGLAESCFVKPTCFSDGGRGMETLVNDEVRWFPSMLDCNPS